MAIVKQHPDIETVQQLRNALADYPPDMRVGDAFIEGIMITHRVDGSAEYLEVS